MLGDFYAGQSFRFGADTVVDRLIVLADDLDAPLVLPGAGTALTITELGQWVFFHRICNRFSSCKHCFAQELRFQELP